MGNLSEGGFLRRAEAPRVSEKGEATRESHAAAVEERLVPILQKERQAIDPRSFVNEPGYSAEMIKDDEEAMERKLRLKQGAEKSVERKALSSRGERTEAAVFATLQAVLGPEAKVIATSRIDDVLGGKDMAIVWGEGSSQVTIGIDVASFVHDAANKIDRDFQAIDRGVPQEIRYAQIPRGQGVEKKRLENIASARIVLDGNRVEAIGKMLAESGTGPRFAERLGRSSLAYLLLYQVEAQLKAMQRYAVERKKEGIATAYGKALQKIEGALNRLSPEAKSRIEEALGRDQAYVAVATHAWEGVQKRKLPPETKWPIQ